MPTARYLLAAATGGDGRIYAIGGFNGSGILNTVEAYRP
jgi:Kelch motif